MQPTPLEPAPWAGDVHLKREDVHELGTFKWRGALAVLDREPRDVVTASTGNHGAATAWAAARVGVAATVFLPLGAAATKVAILDALGATVVRTGADVDEAKDAARTFAGERGLFFFEDGAEPAQLDGYGAIAEEMLDQLGEPPAAVVVPLGNGALLAGVGRALGGLSPETFRIGVAAKEAPVMVESWEAGRALVSDRCATIADGLAVRVAIPFAVDAMLRHADEVLLVSERRIASAVRDYWEAGVRAEPAAAAALAALDEVSVDGPVVLVVTGRNVDDELLERCLADPDSFPG